MCAEKRILPSRAWNGRKRRAVSAPHPTFNSNQPLLVPLLSLWNQPSSTVDRGRPLYCDIGSAYSLFLLPSISVSLYSYCSCCCCFYLGCFFHPLFLVFFVSVPSQIKTRGEKCNFVWLHRKSERSLCVFMKTPRPCES